MVDAGRGRPRIVMCRWSLRVFLAMCAAIGALAGLLGKAHLDYQAELQVGSMLTSIYARYSTTSIAPSFVTASLPVSWANMFDRIVSVDCEGVGIRDQEFCRLAECRYLTSVRADQTEVSREAVLSLVGLEHLNTLHVSSYHVDRLDGFQEFTSLERLNLSYCRISSKDARWLAPFRSLKHLDLSCTSMDGRSFKDLSKLSGLRSLKLQRDLTPGRIPCNAAELAHLSQLNELEELMLIGFTVTNDCAPHIARMANLKLLSLDGTLIGDDGAAQIAKSGSIRSISLKRTDVTDEGVLRLVAMPTLETLDVSDTDVTSEGVSNAKRMAERSIEIIMK